VLWKRLKEIRGMEFYKKKRHGAEVGGCQAQAPSAWRLVKVEIAGLRTEPNFKFGCKRKSFARSPTRRPYRLLRSNLTQQQPAQLWHLYIQLTQVEEAFKNLKGDLSLRPLFHKKEARIEAHIFVAFLAYCLHTTRRRWLRDLAPG